MRTKKEIENNVDKFVKLLDFFEKLTDESPCYNFQNCPFNKKYHDHYCLSSVSSGDRAIYWNCPLCGLEYSE